MEQHPLTVLTPLVPERVADLEVHLRAIGDNVRDNPYLRFAESPSTHFARFVILPAEYGQGPRLLFTSNHDGDLRSYAAELSRLFGPELDRIWSHCLGYAPGDAADATRLLQFLETYSLPTPAFYVACRGASAAAIHQANETREALERQLDDPDSPLRQRWEASPGGASRPPGPAAASGAISPDSFLSRLVEWIVGVRRGVQEFDRRTDARNLPEFEDRVVQNAMTILSPIKPGWLPLVLVRIVLWAARRSIAQTHGSLSGLTTIHFARWVILEKERALLFESNYDGSWENYINDFVDFASVGMNAIWATAVDFPRGGSRDIEAFKAIIRRYQVPTQVFYSAYPYSTVRNNLYNLQLAEALERSETDPLVREFVSGVYRLAG